MTFPPQQSENKWNANSQVYSIDVTFDWRYRQHENLFFIFLACPCLVYCLLVDIETDQPAEPVFVDHTKKSLQENKGNSLLKLNTEYILSLGGFLARASSIYSGLWPAKTDLYTPQTRRVGTTQSASDDDSRTLSSSFFLSRLVPLLLIYLSMYSLYYIYFFSP